MRVYAGGTKRHEEKQTGEGERWHGAGKFQCCICRPRFFVFRFGAVRQPISVVLPKHGRMFLPPWGRGLGWVARIDMGNTLSTHMGNTSIVCREISPVPQELLHTSSQAPKGPIDGVCDEVCSSSASRKKCVAGRRRAQKVLPMSMRIVLPMSMRRAVRASPLPTAYGLAG